MALSNCSVSPEEENMLEVLLDRHRLHNKLSPWESDFENSNDVAPLTAVIFTNENRYVAVKLAYTIAAVSKNSGDEAAIDSDESKVYRLPIENLGLPQTTIEIIEQETNAEPAKQPRPWQILHGTFGNLKYWPESGVMPSGHWAHFKSEEVISLITANNFIPNSSRPV
jgi:hypothetical protein